MTRNGKLQAAAVEAAWDALLAETASYLDAEAAVAAVLDVVAASIEALPAYGAASGAPIDSARSLADIRELLRGGGEA